MMVPFGPLQWYRFERYDGTVCSDIVVPIRQYYQFIELRAWAVEMGEAGPYAKEKNYGIYLYGKSAENFNLMSDIFVAANVIAVPVNAGSEKESRLRLTMICPVTM